MLFIKIFTLLSVLSAIIRFYLSSRKKPSNNRDWSEDQKILPFAKIKKNLISVYNIRNFRYKSVDKFIPEYYNKTFDLNEIKSIDFIIEPFLGFFGAAHVFLSFGFNNGQYLAISVEIRKKRGEKFSAIKGLFNNYELMYVAADERDVIKLRSNHRKNKVYIYPIKCKKKEKQKIFIEMAEKMNQLKNKPEFYNTITNTCATNIIKHLNNIMSNKINFNYKILIPAFIDKLILSLGLIDTDLSIKEARKIFLINEKTEKYHNNENFSELIRE